MYACPNPDCGKPTLPVYNRDAAPGDPVKLRPHMMTVPGTRRRKQRCPQSNTTHPAADLTWVGPAQTTTRADHLSGVSAWFTGECVYGCPDPIVPEQQIVARGNGYAHVDCHRKVHE